MAQALPLLISYFLLVSYFLIVPVKATMVHHYNRLRRENLLLVCLRISFEICGPFWFVVVKNNDFLSIKSQDTKTLRRHSYQCSLQQRWRGFLWWRYVHGISWGSRHPRPSSPARRICNLSVKPEENIHVSDLYMLSTNIFILEWLWLKICLCPIYVLNILFLFLLFNCLSDFWNIK